MTHRHVVLVCGGRDFVDVLHVYRTLNSIHSFNPITRIVHGGARGADTLAGSWANANRITCHVYDADWKAQPKAAGPIRNQKMLTAELPDLVVAFPGGRGTADMMSRARRARVRVMLG